MSQLDQEAGIERFLELANQWVRSRFTSRQLLNAFVEFYRQTRIVGAGIEPYDDSDMFSIETIPSAMLGIPAIQDLRLACDDDMLPTSEQRFVCISICRTVHAIDDLPEDSEFDDDGFNMSAELYFEPFNEESNQDWPSIIEVPNPNELLQHLPEFLKHPKLQPLLDKIPTHVEAFVGGAG